MSRTVSFTIKVTVETKWDAEKLLNGGEVDGMIKSIARKYPDAKIEIEIPSTK